MGGGEGRGPRQRLRHREAVAMACAAAHRTRRAATEGSVHAAKGALGALHGAVRRAHDGVRLAALEVVDVHVGRAVRFLPGHQQQLGLEMRDRNAGEIVARPARTCEGSTPATPSPAAHVWPFHRSGSRRCGRVRDRGAIRPAPPGAFRATATTIGRRTRRPRRRGRPGCRPRPRASRVSSRAP